jgi:hypothetical protein
MAFKKEDLLKFSKSTELGIKLIEDDSSAGSDGNEGTEVKILHLTKEIQAVGSIPTPDGGEMKAKGTKVYVADSNIEEMLKDLTEVDGVLVYKGPMHLDVSKPSGRTVNGQFTITKPAKIWLTKTKYSRSGGQLRQAQTNNINNLINKMFAGGAVLDLAAESATASGDTTATGEKKEPEVVANQQ